MRIAQQVIDDAVEQGDENRGLAVEVTVDARAGDAGRRTDLGDRDRMKPLAPHQVSGCSQNPTLAFGISGAAMRGQLADGVSSDGVTSQELLGSIMPEVRNRFALVAIAVAVDTTPLHDRRDGGGKLPWRSDAPTQPVWSGTEREVAVRLTVEVDFVRVRGEVWIAARG